MVVAEKEKMKGKCKGRERKGKVLYPENLENVLLELLLVAIRFFSAGWRRDGGEGSP